MHLELVWMVITVIAYQFIAHYLHQGAFFIVGAVLFWGAWLWLQLKKDPKCLQHWGYRTENFGITCFWCAGVVAVGALGLAGWAALHDQLHWRANLGICLLLYPFFGWMQQLLLQGLLARRLAEFITSPTWVTILSATLFGLIHFPNTWLMLATFCLALVLVPIYLRFRNLWPLGLVHGWLGALLYYWGFGRDPLWEVFGRFMLLWAQ